MKEFKYDVALSFASEDKEFVLKIARGLIMNNLRAFYYDYEEINNWGKNLHSFLDSVYQEDARHCIIFISKNYSEKPYTRLELKFAQSRALREKDYILIVKIDNTKIPGIADTDIFIDAAKFSPEEICQGIIKKLRVNTKAGRDHNEISNVQIPIIKRTIKGIEKNKFLKGSFIVISDLFESNLKSLKMRNPHVEYSLTQVNDSKFAVIVTIDHKVNRSCKVWIGHLIGSSISFLQSDHRIDFYNDINMNELATLWDNGKEIFFRIYSIGFGKTVEDIDKEKATAEDVFRYFWVRFLTLLQLDSEYEYYQGAVNE